MGVRRSPLVRAAVIAIAAIVWPRCAAAHPAPFSYLDLKISANRVDATLVAHIFDLAHELNLAPSDLLDPAVARARAADIETILRRRLSLVSSGHTLVATSWSAPEILADRQEWTFSFTFGAAAPSAFVLEAALFPYDAQHQTFINVYEQGVLRAQSILGAQHRTFDYFAGTTGGTLAVVRKFVQAGIQHILIGPDHLLFLVGLLLLGGSVRRLLLVVTAFTIAHSVTLSVAVLGVLTPPARLIEPAIALSIVYVGLDNLTSRGGRDMRAWIALAFGLIHGFGFASVLRDMDLPARALGWSLFSFNLGVELGQLAVVVGVASLVMALRRASVTAGQRLAWAGSIVVIVAGAFWFVQRVWFPGGLS